MSQEQEEKSAEVDVTYNSWQDKQAATLRERFPAYIAALEGMGVTEAVFSYSGEGDEGEIYEFELVSPSETEEELPGTLERELLDWAYEILNLAYMGWQDGDGSRGEIHLDVKKKAVVIHHENRVYDYEAEEPLVALTVTPTPSKQGESSA